MKKSLIALAVAGALAAPVAAMADTTIYGAANVSYDLMNNGNAAAGAFTVPTLGGAAVVCGTAANPCNGISSNHVSSNASRIGFKGSEDLGGGTSAVYQVEQGLAIDTGTWGSDPRNTFAGLSGESWGTLILGRHDTPYKIATRGLDLFADTIADNRSLMGQTGGGLVNHDARLSNVVAYISPAMSGFTAAVAYVAAAEGAISSAHTKGTAWSLAGMYNAGPVNASLSYQVIDGGTAPDTNGLATTATAGPFAGKVVNVLSTGNKASAWKLGGGYTMDQFTVNAAYEKSSSSIAGVDLLTQANWYLAGKFNVTASDAVKLAYTSAGKVGSPAAVNSEANQLSVGYDHGMSKRTTVYALYTKLTNKAASAYSLGAAGFATSAVAARGLDADPSAFSVGMKHTF